MERAKGANLTPQGIFEAIEDWDTKIWRFHNAGDKKLLTRLRKLYKYRSRVIEDSDRILGWLAEEYPSEASVIYNHPDGRRYWKAVIRDLVKDAGAEIQRHDGDAEG